MEPVLLNDRRGDAVDAVLAAVAAGSAFAQGFAGVPERAARSGEGWIFGAAELPRALLPTNGSAPALWPREVTAAHEAGHAIAFLACGIPVDFVEAVNRAIPGGMRFGWTEVRENEWTRENGLVDGDVRYVRRLLGKAGGLAGELVAGVFDAETSMRGASDDLRQIGGALQTLGLLRASAATTPMSAVLAAVECAAELIRRHRVTFDSLRRGLALRDQVVPEVLAATWGAEDDRQLVARLRTVLGGN